MEQSLSGVRRWIVNGLLSILAFALLGAAIWSNRVEMRQVFERQIDYRFVAIAFGLYMVALVATFLRWFVLVRALDLPFRISDAIRLGFIGNVFNLVIPGAVGGDVIKGAFLIREQSRKTLALASMVIDRALGLLGLFVLASLGGAVAWSTSDPKIKLLISLAWGATAMGVIGLAIAFSPGLYRPMLRLLAARPRLAAMLEELATLAALYRSRLDQVAIGLSMAVFSHTLFVTAFYLVDRALFPNAPTIGEHFVVTPLALFSTAVPLPFGALGLSEQVTDLLFAPFGHPGGAIAMLGYRAVVYAAGLVSVVVYLANAQQVQTLRSSAAESETS